MFTKIMKKQNFKKKDDRFHLAISDRAKALMLKAKAKYIEERGEEPTWSALIEEKFA